VTFARRAVTAAKSTIAMAATLGVATRRPDMALRYASRFLTDRERPVELAWKGFKLTARGCDWPALQEVLIENEYGALVPALTAKPAPFVADLGANIGTFALFSFSVAPGAIVHSYEPAAATYGILAETQARNGGYRWTTHHGAAWREDGSITFQSGAASTAGRVDASGNETAPAFSLATILGHCGGAIDVAKIDIEGAEEALVAGRESEIARIGTLVIELHPGRCDCAAVTRTLRASFGTLYRIPGRRSAKPLLLATRLPVASALPVYTDEGL
jgi:FkbM family methyltransferase